MLGQFGVAQRIRPECLRRGDRDDIGKLGEPDLDDAALPAVQPPQVDGRRTAAGGRHVDHLKVLTGTGTAEEEGQLQRAGKIVEAVAQDRKAGGVDVTDEQRLHCALRRPHALDAQGAIALAAIANEQVEIRALPGQLFGRAPGQARGQRHRQQQKQPGPSQGEQEKGDPPRPAGRSPRRGHRVHDGLQPDWAVKAPYWTPLSALPFPPWHGRPAAAGAAAGVVGG